MKIKIILLFVVLFWNLSYSQKYDVGVISALGYTAKTTGSIIITDDKVTIISGEHKAEYKFLKKVNGIIYFTDEIMTHYFTILEESGKKKGFVYDTIIFFHPDKNFTPNTFSQHWCKKIND